jgi:hypothetical protein
VSTVSLDIILICWKEKKINFLKNILKTQTKALKFIQLINSTSSTWLLKKIEIVKECTNIKQISKGILQKSW